MPVSSYLLSVDGSALATAYIKEEADVQLKNDLTNALGTYRIAQAISCLDKIQIHGDRETYIQARRLKEWLLRHSSVKSSL